MLRAPAVFFGSSCEMRFVLQITDALTLPQAELLSRLGSLKNERAPSDCEFAVQLRDPQLSTIELLRMGEKLRDATLNARAKLIVNDRLDIARLLCADGIHLGQRSVSIETARAFLGQNAWISRSAHSLHELIVAAREGANAALLSPIFVSPGKGVPIGLDALKEGRQMLNRHGFAMKLYALGGVSMKNAEECFGAGADGVASIRADLTRLCR